MRIDTWDPVNCEAKAPWSTPKLTRIRRKKSPPKAEPDVEPAQAPLGATSLEPAGSSQPLNVYSRAPHSHLSGHVSYTDATVTGTGYSGYSSSGIAQPLSQLFSEATPGLVLDEREMFPANNESTPLNNGPQTIPFETVYEPDNADGRFISNSQELTLALYKGCVFGMRLDTFTFVYPRSPDLSIIKETLKNFGYRWDPGKQLTTYIWCSLVSLTDILLP